jgi:hypothetical protein
MVVSESRPESRGQRRQSLDPSGLAKTCRQLAAMAGEVTDGAVSR